MMLGKQSVRVLAVSCAAVFVTVYFWDVPFSNREDLLIERYLKEAAREQDVSVQLALYQDLLQRVDIGRAQEAHAKALASTPDAHIIGHEAGYVLYRREGIAGLSQCKSNLNNDACAHGVLKLFVEEHGTEGLLDAASACNANDTVVQKRECPHGIGHGFLVYTGYDNLPQALALCHETFGEDADDDWACAEGVFMESVNVNLTGVRSILWYNPDDPMYPCMEPSILAYPQAHDACWFENSMLTLGRTYPSFEGNISRVATYCSALSHNDDVRTCFHGVARQLHGMHGSDIAPLSSWCRFLGAHANACHADIAGLLYNFGDEEYAVALCEQFARAKGQCFRAIYDSIVSQSYASPQARDAACEAIGIAVRVDACRAHVAERYE